MSEEFEYSEENVRLANISKKIVSILAENEVHFLDMMNIIGTIISSTTTSILSQNRENSGTFADSLREDMAFLYENNLKRIDMVLEILAKNSHITPIELSKEIGKVLNKMRLEASND